MCDQSSDDDSEVEEGGRSKEQEVSLKSSAGTFYCQNSLLCMYVFVCVGGGTQGFCVCVCVYLRTSYSIEAAATPTVKPLPEPPAGILKKKPGRRHLGGMVQWMSWHDSGKNHCHRNMY